MAAEIIRDPVHGFVELEPYEVKLVDSRPFRRLRHIKQLGLTCYVWPGAEHSRFGHSLGVMHLATRVFDGLVGKGLSTRLSWNSEEQERWRRTLRAAALLHDLGHPPFSHATQALMPDDQTHHEEMSAGIVRSTEIEGILKAVGVDVEEVCELIVGEAPAVPQVLVDVLSGDFDVDRMDYLARDSLFAGVPYGSFDSDRLIRCLTLYPESSSKDPPVLALEIGGIHAAEGLILARYFMFSQVYFNKVRRSYDILLTDAMKKVLSASGGRYPSSVDDYLAWDDRSAWRAIEGLAGACNSAHRLLNRSHYRRVHETRELPEASEMDRFLRILAGLKDKYGQDHVIQDDAVQAPHRFLTSSFWVRELDRRFTPLDNPEEPPSRLILSLKPIMQRRVYATVDDEFDEMREFCNSFLTEGA